MDKPPSSPLGTLPIIDAYGSQLDLEMVRGTGLYLYDKSGNQYLDMLSGWGCNVLGHTPPALQTALHTQLESLVNVTPSFRNEPSIRYAHALTKRAGFSRVFFTNSGAEANESALKFARRYGQEKLSGAYELIAFTGGFHGRTLATMSLSHKVGWSSLFEPKIGGVIHVPWEDINAFKAAITPKTCAVFLEVIQGEGGVNVATKDFITELRASTQHHNLLLIIDEVQTGMGRTGKWFAYEHYDIIPDVITLAKGIGGGFPLSAVLFNEEHNCLKSGDLGGTYTGQPLAMAAGHAVLQTLDTQNLTENARKMGVALKQTLQHLASTTSLPISRIRGKGLMLAFDVQTNMAQNIVNQGLKHGLIVNAVRPSSIRLLPPLIIENQHIHEFSTRFTAAYQAALTEQ